jgi:hypothetical protein
MTETTTTAVDRDDLVAAAYALLMAAILLADLQSSMRSDVQAAMPADLRNRMQATYCQDSFNRLPMNIQAEARALVLADPDIQAARSIDSGSRS